MSHAQKVAFALLAVIGATACVRAPGPVATTPAAVAPRVKPGITVLLEDSIHLIRGKRIGLITNHTGIDGSGVSDIDLLHSGERARAAGVVVAALFAPEHGIRGTEDRTDLANDRDERTGLVIHSLYGANTVAPPDSTLAGIDVLVIDLQDIGTRTWTYVGLVVYSMRAAARNRIPILVLDRPNPIGGVRRDAPMLDSAIANPDDNAPGRRGQAYALWPFPLRHGMTMGEMALFFNSTLSLGADLHVVPMAGWRRSMYFDETGLPWVKPSPNMPTLASAIVYPALVPYEGSNLSVGRGTPESFQKFGAPWLDGVAVAKLLNDRELPGVRFDAERFTPIAPPDRKYGGTEIGGVRIVVLDRERAAMGRVSAAILWAVNRLHSDSLVIRGPTFDHRFGTARAREALLRGDDPDSVVDREVPAVVEFEQRARKFLIYR